MEVEKANGWEWRMKVDEGDMEVGVMNEGLKKKF